MHTEFRVGVRILRTIRSRFEPLNLRSAGVFSLSSSGGEGWGEEALSVFRCMVRGNSV